jgi:glycosyltransferase involved in cell wall biosynthesis
VNVLLWHVHGSYTTSFVQGSHRYLLPVVPDRGPDGRGRARTWDWPDSAVEVTPEAARYERIDVAILQRPIEVETLAEEWTGRKPGRDLPALYLEHNTPPGAVAEMRHHVAGRDDLTIVHVTNFNALMWDSGGTPTKVIEHGIVDPGYRYWGVLPHAAAVINEPGRRGRVVGADLLADLAEAAPVDLFGIATEDSLSQAQLHREMARRRFYLHPYRWTSLGLSLLEAMQLGMPVVALNTTEVPIAVPPCAGVVSNRIKDLKEAMTWLISDRNAARDMGVAARASALKRYGLARFLRDWDLALEEAVA